MACWVAMLPIGLSSICCSGLFSWSVTTIPERSTFLCSLVRLSFLSLLKQWRIIRLNVKETDIIIKLMAIIKIIQVELSTRLLSFGEISSQSASSLCINSLKFVFFRGLNTFGIACGVMFGNFLFHGSPEVDHRAFRFLWLMTRLPTVSLG